MTAAPAVAPAMIPLAVLAATLAGCGSSSSSKSHPASATTPAARTRSATGASATVPAAGPQGPASATASAGSARSVTASAGGVSATLSAGSHTPKVNEIWHIHLAVSRAGRPLRASVSYEFLLGSQLVARRSHYTFTGRFSDFSQWPAASAGYPLTFRAVVVAGPVTIDLDYPVRVHT